MNCFWPQKLTEWADLVAKLAAVFLVVFGIVEYMNGKREDRVMRTQGFLSQYMDGPIRSARDLVSTTLRDNEQTIVDLLGSSLIQSSAKEAHADLVHFLAYESHDGKGIVSAIDDLMAFYETVQVCVEEGLCEKSVALAYFQVDAKRLLDNFWPYVIERRRRTPGYAEEVERLTAMHP